MKKHIAMLILLVLYLMSRPLHAQSKRIDGNGKLIKNMFLIKQVSQVKLNGSWINVVIECGKMPLLEITSDQNILPYITVDEADNWLSIHSGDKWIEPTKVQVRIQLPYLSLLETEGWVAAQVMNVSGNDLIFKGKVGKLSVQGVLNEMTIRTELANVDLRKLDAKKLVLHVSGHGQVVYSGSPVIISRNGLENVHSQEEATEQQQRTADELDIVLYNNRVTKARLIVEGPQGKPFSYGFAMDPYSKKKERWPEGTTLYWIKAEFEKGELLRTLSREDNGKTVKTSE